MENDELMDVLGEVPPATDGALATLPDAKELAKAQRAAASIQKADRNRGKAVERLAESVAVLTGADGGDPGAGPHATPAAVARILPDKEKIRICRRETDGKLTQINDYALNEISVDGDVASFVNRRLRPHFGDFDYVVQVIGKDGQARPHSTVPRRDAREDRPPPEGPASLVKAIVDALKSNQPPAAPAVPSVSDKTMQGLMDMVSSGQKIDPVMLMMMPMLQGAMKPAQPERSNEAVLGIVSQIAERLERLERRRDEPAPTQFPVLPPVAEEPRIDVAEILKTAMAASAPRPQEGITLKDLLDFQDRVRPPARESLGLLDMVKLLPTLIPAISTLTGRDALQRQLDEMRDDLKERRRNLGETSIDEEMNKLIRARDVALKLVGGGQRESDWKDAVLHIWDTIPNHLDAAGKFARELGARERAAKAAPRLSAGSPRPKAQDAAAKDEDDGTLVVTQEARAALDELAEAGGDDVLARAFAFLQAAAAGNDRWKKYAGLLVTLAQKGDAERTMNVVAAILKGLVDGSLLDAGKAERIFRELGARSDDLMAALSQG